MRHIFAVIFLVMIFAVPWLLYNPEQANYLYSMIGSAEDQLASVILTHSPKSVMEIKSRYNSGVNQGIFHSKTIPQKVKILLVPGHEPEEGGAEYGSINERDMTVELAKYLQQFLGSNEKYEVTVTRDEHSWSPLFAEYFKTNWNEIIAWTEGHKAEMIKLTKMGEFHPVVPRVIHNSAPQDKALRLYGIGKWSNENSIDIVIHIHFNDNPGHPKNSPGEYSGFAIYVPQNQYYNSSTTQALANAILGRLKKFNPVSNLAGEKGGIVQDQNLIAIGAYNSLDAASMLIEYGYIYEPQFTNPSLRDVAIKDLAFQTYLGLQDFFDDRNPDNISGSFDTLVMPYVWDGQISDSKHNVKDVYSLQTALVQNGDYPPIARSFSDCPRSGSYGPCTKTAIGAFQKKHGIVGEDGMVGPKTLEILNRSYAVKAI